METAWRTSKHTSNRAPPPHNRSRTRVSNYIRARCRRFGRIRSTSRNMDCRSEFTTPIYENQKVHGPCSWPLIGCCSLCLLVALFRTHITGQGLDVCTSGYKLIVHSIARAQLTSTIDSAYLFLFFIIEPKSWLNDRRRDVSDRADLGRGHTCF